MCLGIGGWRGREMGFAPWFEQLRVRQGDQAVSLHAQQRHAAGHVLDLSVGLDPGEQLTQFARQPCAFELWVLLHQVFDGLDILGAELASAAVKDPMNLDISLRVNGQRRQASNTREMIYSIAEQVSHWSKMTLEPGDVISTGSPEGVALSHKLDSEAFYLKPGDIVEAEIEGVGTLRNVIV